MKYKKQIQRLERLAPDVAKNYWVAFWRNKRCRCLPKLVLLDGQRGRTHKRKQRGTRKRKNMGWRQYFSRFTATGEW